MAMATSTHMLAVLVQVCLFAGVRSKHPDFSWRTVPVFAETSNVSGVFDDEAMATIAKFPLFVAEKAYDYPSPGFAEDKLLPLTRQLRALNPNITLVFYYNANLDLTDYRLYNTTAQHAPHWWVRNSSSDVLITPIDSGAGARPPFPYNANGGGVPAYDFTVPDMRAAWVQECFDVTSQAGGFDGCMIDRWTRSPKFGQGFTPVFIANWTKGRDEATGALAMRASNNGVYLVGEGDNVSAVSDPGYGNGGASLVRQLALAQQGIGLLASYTPKATGQRFETELAKFLVGAAKGHYFGAGTWTCNHTSREGVTWHPEYDSPLGTPLGNATVLNSVYTRNFSFGTNVSYDMTHNVGTIDWALSFYSF